MTPTEQRLRSDIASIITLTHDLRHHQSQHRYYSRFVDRNSAVLAEYYLRKADETKDAMKVARRESECD